MSNDDGLHASTDGPGVTSAAGCGQTGRPRHNLGTVSENVDVVVLGAGISGLCLAHRVARAGRKVLVLESADAPGGCFRSERQPAGFWFEMGAHTLYNSYGSLLSIIDELGLRDRMLTRQKAPFRMLVDGKLRSIPSQLSLPELFASAWHAFSERKQGRTVADYYGRLVGRRNWKRVVAPLFATVFSQPADNFPAEMLFKKRTRRKDIPRSYTFAGGVQTLTDRIAAEPGITVRTNAQVHALARTEGNFVVEIAGGDRVFARAWAWPYPRPRPGACSRPSAPEIATSPGPHPDCEDRVCGCRGRGTPRSAAALGGHRADQRYLLLGGHARRGSGRAPARLHLPLPRRPDARRTHRAHLRCHWPGRGEFACVATHSASLPSLALGHAAIAEEIDRHLPGSGLYITGNYFGGLAIEDCSLRSAKEAERLIAEAGC
jgi:oxygen-dependent protoporphyrinogen oxidase